MYLREGRPVVGLAAADPSVPEEESGMGQAGGLLDGRRLELRVDESNIPVAAIILGTVLPDGAVAWKWLFPKEELASPSHDPSPTTLPVGIVVREYGEGQLAEQEAHEMPGEEDIEMETVDSEWHE